MAVENLILRRIADVDAAHLQAFTCGKDTLDDFLREQAALYDKYGLTRTTVAYLDGHAGPVGYFSLSTDSLKLSKMEIMELGLNEEVPINFFPAVKITRLAVSSTIQSNGIGSDLLQFIEGLVYESEVAARLITVDADNNARTLAFYERHGFIHSMVNANNRQNAQRQQHGQAVEEQPHTISMFKDIYAGE